MTGSVDSCSAKMESTARGPDNKTWPIQAEKRCSNRDTTLRLDQQRVDASMKNKNYEIVILHQQQLFVCLSLQPCQETKDNTQINTRVCLVPRHLCRWKSHAVFFQMCTNSAHIFSFAHIVRIACWEWMPQGTVRMRMMKKKKKNKIWCLSWSPTVARTMWIEECWHQNCRILSGQKPVGTCDFEQ